MRTDTMLCPCGEKIDVQDARGIAPIPVWAVGPTFTAHDDPENRLADICPRCERPLPQTWDEVYRALSFSRVLLAIGELQEGAQRLQSLVNGIDVDALERDRAAAGPA